ncbi:MAG TPA: diguanylate cyclase [Candidatus Limnocylindrales bacterium]|nr:diguanylate cyclase [Candidatus Limnocylindrales bacterium]
MAHHPARARPLLLLLVFGAFLAVVGATATGQAILVTIDGGTSELSSRVAADATIVRSVVNLHLAAADVAGGALPADRRAELSRQLAIITGPGEILSAALLTKDGSVLAASDAALVGRAVGADPAFDHAVRARVVDAAVLERGRLGPLAPSTTSSLLRSFFPVIADGPARDVVAVVAVWRDAAPIFAALDEARIHVVVITLSAALVTAGLLWLIFRSAQGRLTRQTIQLLESTRRDALTGLLNHGAVVEALTGQVDEARRRGGGITVAIVDLDNLGLLNETYGHAAGDRALTEVVRLLRETAAEGATIGRYGPDEFLLVAPGPAAAELEPSLERLRDRLADLALTFESSERLPVTVSAGICAYPTNGESVTTLLSVAALTLDEAKASGGDTIRVAGARAGAADTRSFDVFHGLVIAVDTKDRYTRRHSEDVARYADFIAERLELDHDTRRALHTAALLHDVGKIGIPDQILRKPGRLTPGEYDTLKQHVALGDMIVRDLPNIDLIRAGVRHHHERWDGDGYLDRLAAEEIPLIARILAVGDAFSAMTTTRPYRKGMPVEDALRRLEDAAGTQLDEHLALLFVEAMRTAERAPRPGEQPSARLWTPDLQVA